MVFLNSEDQHSSKKEIYVQDRRVLDPKKQVISFQNAKCIPSESKSGIINAGQRTQGSSRNQSVVARRNGGGKGGGNGKNENNEGQEYENGKKKGKKRRKTKEGKRKKEKKEGKTKEGRSERKKKKKSVEKNSKMAPKWTGIFLHRANAITV